MTWPPEAQTARQADTPWDDATIERLRALWDAGFSGSQIARRLGVSKNSVVGKAHRLDLPTRPSPIHGKGEGNRARTPRPSRAGRTTLPALPSALPHPKPPLVDPLRKARGSHPPPRTTLPPQSAPAAPQQAPPLVRNRTCAFPLNDRRPWRFCDAPVTAMDKPYCAECCRRAYARREAA